MPDLKDIFDNKADDYDLLVSFEDYNNNLQNTIMKKIGNAKNMVMIDFGTGTGRVARLFSPYFKHIYAFDASESMIRKAKEISEEKNIKNITYDIGDHRQIPIDSNIADIIIEGWSFCCIRAWNQNWKTEIDKAFKEVERTIKKDGKFFLIETLGTMTDGVNPPKALGELYEYYENIEKFNKEIIRTDYKFESVNEASKLCTFFFGNEVGEIIENRKMKIVPEYTGIWEKHYQKIV